MRKGSRKLKKRIYKKKKIQLAYLGRTNENLLFLLYFILRLSNMQKRFGCG